MDARAIREAAIAAYREKKKEAKKRIQEDIEKFRSTEDHARSVLSQILRQEVTSPFKPKLGNCRFGFNRDGSLKHLKWDHYEWHTQVEDMYFTIRIEKSDLYYIMNVADLPTVMNLRRGQSWWEVHIWHNCQWYKVTSFTRLGQVLTNST